MDGRGLSRQLCERHLVLSSDIDEPKSDGHPWMFNKQIPVAPLNMGRPFESVLDPFLPFFPPSSLSPLSAP
eukprot:15544050-Heterocapsa_arctica.AAC.1